MYSLTKLEKATASQLETDRRGANRSGLFLAKFIPHMSTNRYLPAFDQHSDIAIRYSATRLPQREQ